jgi:hypothetical protein
MDLGTLPEDGVRLIEEEDAVHAIGLAEDPVEVLLRLADVLVHDGREIDDVQVEPELAGDHLSRQRLAGPGVTGEEGGQPAAAARVGETPAVQHRVAMSCPCGDVAKLCEQVARQDEIGP